MGSDFGWRMFAHGVCVGLSLAVVLRFVVGWAWNKRRGSK